MLITIKCKNNKSLSQAGYYEKYIYMRTYLCGKMGWIIFPEYDLKRVLPTRKNQKHSLRANNQKEKNGVIAAPLSTCRLLPSISLLGFLYRGPTIVLGDGTISS